MCISLMPWSTDVVDTFRCMNRSRSSFSPARLAQQGFVCSRNGYTLPAKGSLTADNVDDKTRTRMNLLILRIPVVAPSYR